MDDAKIREWAGRIAAEIGGWIGSGEELSHVEEYREEEGPLDHDGPAAAPWVVEAVVPILAAFAKDVREEDKKLVCVECRTSAPEPQRIYTDDERKPHRWWHRGRGNEPDTYCNAARLWEHERLAAIRAREGGEG